MSLFSQDKKTRPWEMVILAAFMLLSAGLSASILRFGFDRFGRHADAVTQPASDVPDGSAGLSEGAAIANENSVPDGLSSAVAGEEDAKNTYVASSENFQATQVSVGSNLLFMEDGGGVPLSIYDIKSDSFITSDKGESKIVITWKTSKPAISDLEYGKSGQSSLSDVKEDSYGYVHSAILSDLEQKNAYTYRIIGKDRYGNTQESDYFGIYTAAKPVSVFDMISDSLNEIFGWAVKRS